MDENDNNEDNDKKEDYEDEPASDGVEQWSQVQNPLMMSLQDLTNCQPN